MSQFDKFHTLFFKRMYSLSINALSLLYLSLRILRLGEGWTRAKFVRFLITEIATLFFSWFFCLFELFGDVQLLLWLIGDGPRVIGGDYHIQPGMNPNLFFVFEQELNVFKQLTKNFQQCFLVVSVVDSSLFWRLFARFFLNVVVFFILACFISLLLRFKLLEIPHLSRIFHLRNDGLLHLWIIKSIRHVLWLGSALRFTLFIGNYLDSHFLSSHI